MPGEFETEFELRESGIYLLRLTTRERVFVKQVPADAAHCWTS
jgi:hypothetical protein